MNKYKNLLEEAYSLINNEFFNNSPIVAFIWNNDTNWSVDKVSKNIEGLLGYSQNDFISKRIIYAELIHPEDMNLVQEEAKYYLQKKLHKGELSPYRIKTKDNTYKWVKETTLVVYDLDGSISHYVGYISDCSELVKRKEELKDSIKTLEKQNKLASMGQAIEDISHQWKQPLNIISVSASGLLLNCEQETLKKENILISSQTILEQSKYLAHTITSFINYIKKKDHITNETLSLDKVIQDTLSLTSNSLNINHIKYIQNIDGGQQFLGNKNTIIEALINIIFNSKDALLEKIKKDEDKYIFIESKRSKNNITLLIYDTAGGIAESIIDKIFNNYFTTKEKSNGTGLGLAITKKIIEKNNNGTIEVFNKEFEFNNKNYKGACFKIVFNLLK